MKLIAPGRPQGSMPSVTGLGGAVVRVPRLRGVSHALAFFLAAGAALRMIALAPAGRATVAVAVYGAGLVALFGGSALYHRWPAHGRVKAALQRLDHSTIFVFIAASYTPIALLVLDGALASAILVIAWTGAAAGVALSLGWIDAPRRLIAGSYLALGWVALLALPELVQQLGPQPLALLAGGGLLYSVGAVVYARQRPDPWPSWFGFHEIFHALVIVAAAAQYIALVGWVLPAAAA
jgi:hemolysin III